MILTVIVRDTTPLFMEEPIRHRSVQVELTDEQVKKIGLKHLGKNCGHDIYEEISTCFIEEER